MEYNIQKSQCFVKNLLIHVTDFVELLRPNDYDVDGQPFPTGDTSNVDPR